MRIHIQNHPLDGNPRATLQQLQEAAARAGEDALNASIGESDEDFLRHIGDVDVMITSSRVVRRLTSVAAPRLKLIFLTHAGLDSLADLSDADALRGVAILNNSGAHAEKAGEYGTMAALMLAHRMPLFATQQRHEVWERRLSPSVRGRCAVVVGLGAIGSAVAANLDRFGMRVIGVRTRAGAHPHCAQVVASRDLDSVLPQAEFLVLACPLTPETAGLMDRRRIDLLPPDAGIVNIGRGELVDQDALLDALDSGRLSGAVLDVFDREPVPPGHRLWRTGNLTMTPHISAGDPVTYIPRSLDIFFRNLACFRRGERMPNQVDLRRGY
jgi:phosphoglycerate dehydrogenase-like enzyme